MKNSLILVSSLLASLISATPALADMKLASAKNCLACHAVDKKLVGPSFKDIATKYTDQKDMADKLADKIIKGGAGVWGPVPMPGNAQITPEESKRLASWVLTQK